MTNFSSPYGYPIRRNATTCLTDTENDCNRTWGPWRRCCPKAATCTKDGCCPTDGAGYQERIKMSPHCANDTASLYQAKANGTEESPAGGYFCCAEGKTGFEDDRSWVGCADSPSVLDDSYTMAALISSPSSSSISISSTSNPTALSTSTSTASSSANTGAIAGGVVGGVVGAAIIVALLWFLISRRKSAAAPILPPPIQPLLTTAETAYDPWMGHQQRLQELPGESKQPPAPQELEGDTRIMHELPGDYHR